MPIQGNMPIEQSARPARDRPLTPDAPGSALGQNSEWWRDERDMLWENCEAEGNIPVEQEQCAKAENLIHAAIAQAERIGSLNPRLAGSLNELGILYAKQHKYTKAEPMFQRALGVCVAVLGSDHPDAAVILKNIGILKASQRQYAEADLLLKQSLLLTKRVLGQEHPFVAVTMRTIAVIQAIQGHYGDAERFIRRSLEISEKTLASEHPEVATSRKVFAQVLRTAHRDAEVH